MKLHPVALLGLIGNRDWRLRLSKICDNMEAEGDMLLDGKQICTDGGSIILGNQQSLLARGNVPLRSWEEVFGN